jgi:hypothetical protein
MDARELTEKYHKLNGELADITHRLDLLEEEYRKTKLLIEDMSIDVKMLRVKK